MVCGTLSLLLILALSVIVVFLLLLWADYGFTRQARVEAVYLFAAGLAKEVERRTIGEEELATLPACVQRYLRSAGVIGSRRVRTVRLRQQGRLRTRAGARWLPIRAEQYVATDEPGFVWLVRAGGIVRGRDRWAEGEGRMTISLLALLTLGDLHGRTELDQGAMLRYLSELAWLPTAWLDPRIRFESIDENSARVVMRHREEEVEGTLHFDQDGLLRRFVAQRYREHDGRFTLTPWSIEIDDYRQAGAFRIPHRGRASWRLDAGEFDYIEVELTSIDFDALSPYAR